MPSLFLENGHTEISISPVADFAAGDVVSDVHNMRDHEVVIFETFWGVGTTGVVKLTVLSCDNVTPSNSTAIPFWYRITAKGGTPGAITRATAADGVSNSAASDQLIEIEVHAEDMVAGRAYVQLNVDEPTDDPLLGGVNVRFLQPKHAGATHAPTIA